MSIFLFTLAHPACLGVDVLLCVYCYDISFPVFPHVFSTWLMYPSIMHFMYFCAPSKTRSHANTDAKFTAQQHIACCSSMLMSVQNPLLYPHGASAKWLGSNWLQLGGGALKVSGEWTEDIYGSVYGRVYDIMLLQCMVYQGWLDGNDLIQPVLFALC